MNENQNKNRFTEMDSEDYRDKKYYLNQRNEIKKEKNLAKKKRKEERQKKRYQKFQTFKKSISKFQLGTKNYISQLFEPNTLVGIALAIVLILDSRKIQQEVNNQAKKIDQLERVLESKPEQVSYTKEFIQRNWEKIIVTIAPIVIKIVFDYINHYKAAAQNEIKVTQAETRVTKAEQQAEQQAEQSKLELENEKIRSQDALKQEKMEFQTRVREVENKALLKISKLHVTLNRFNDQALLYAKKETEMRQIIVESKTELAAAINQRDFLNLQLSESRKLVQTKNHELSKSSLELKSLKQDLEKLEDSQAKFLTELRNAEEEKFSLKKLIDRKESKLQKIVKKKNDERLELVAKIDNYENDIGTLKVEKEQISKKLESEIREKKLVEEETEKLKAENLKNDVKLQSSIDATNRVVLKMDEINKELQTLRLRNQKISGENKYFKQKLESEAQVADQQEKQIYENDKKNQELESECEKLRAAISDAIIREDALKDKLELEKLELEKASNEKKSQLEKELQKTQKDLENLNRGKKNLEKASAKQEKELAKQYIKQEELIDQHRKQLLTVYQFGTNLFTQLQRERLYQEEEFKTASQESLQVVNQLIDQQEKDQTIPWYRKMIFQIVPEISINKDPKEEKVVIEKESHFFRSWSSEIPHGSIKIKERYNPKTQKLEIIEPTRFKPTKIK
jgi:hypothetical protein